MKATVFQDRDTLREWRGLACGALAAVIWGAYAVSSRRGVAQGLDPFDLAFLRYATAGLAMLPWLIRGGATSLAGVGWPHGLALAALAGPAYVFVGVSGYRFAPVAHGAVIQAGAVCLAGAGLAWAMTGDRIDGRRTSALSLVCLGLAVIAGPSLLHGDRSAWIGDLLFAFAGVMWAIYTALQRRWAVDPLAGTAAVSAVSALLIVPIYLLERGTASLAAAPVALVLEEVLVLGLLTSVVSLIAFAQATADLGIARAAAFPALSPAVAILLAIPLAGEWPDIPQLAGLSLLLTGLLIYAHRRHPPHRAPVPPAE